jgi:BolA protein
VSTAEIITEKLKSAFAPEVLELTDDSEKHRGHGGWREGGETHFHLRMVSARFAGQGRVQRQRAVNKVLAEELAGPVHALAMELRAPGE